MTEKETKTHRKKRALYAGGGAFFLIFGFLVWLGLALYLPNPGNPNRKIPVMIEKGANAREIAHILKEKHLISRVDHFLVAVKIFGAKTKLKAGFYQLPQNVSNARLIALLEKGEAAEIKVSIPEGLRSEKIAGIFQRKVGLDSARFLALVRDTAFVHELGVSANSLEGYLFPDTYFFAYGVRAPLVLRTLVSHFWRVFNDSLKARTRKMGWSVHQVVTLASIIEGEARVDSERALISAVYHNRLKRGMLLQASPTIQFLLPDGPRRLLKRDLQIDSPYNTYRYPGLPPGPINNPGKESILAALYPAPVKYLYFVANGDGTHTFSYTLAQHLKAKRRLDRIRRAYYRKLRLSKKKS